MSFASYLREGIQHFNVFLLELTSQVAVFHKAKFFLVKNL